MKVRLTLLAALFTVAGCGPQSVEVKMGALNDSGQEGKATLTQDGKNVKVVVDIKTGTDTGDQTAHIHDGNCPGLGAVYRGFALQPLQGGKSTTVLEAVTVEELSKKAINVHNSAQASRYVSCGEIP